MAMKFKVSAAFLWKIGIPPPLLADLGIQPTDKLENVSGYLKLGLYTYKLSMEMIKLLEAGKLGSASVEGHRYGILKVLNQWKEQKYSLGVHANFDKVTGDYLSAVAALTGTSKEKMDELPDELLGKKPSALKIELSSGIPPKVGGVLKGIDSIANAISASNKAVESFDITGGYVKGTGYIMNSIEKEFLKDLSHISSIKKQFLSLGISLNVENNKVALYQVLPGTSAGSRYFVIAASVDPVVVVAARYLSNRLSLRVQGDISNVTERALEIGLDLKTGVSNHLSLHVEVHSIEVANMVLGAILSGLGIQWDTPQPSLTMIEGKGI